LTAVLDSLTDLLIAFDDKQQLAFVNQSACKWLDSDRDSLVGKKLISVIAKRYPRWNLSPVLAFEPNQVQRLQIPESEDWFEVQILLLDGMRCLLMRPISEQMRVTQELQRSNESLNQAQALGHVGSCEFDIETQRAHWSRELFRLYDLPYRSDGPTVEEAMNRIHPEDRDCLDACYSRCIEFWIPVQMEYRVVHRDGQVRYLRGLCHPLEDRRTLMGSIIDVTEMRAYETRLHEQVIRVQEQAVQLEMQKEELQAVNLKLEELASLDGLTGLTNHRVFHERLTEEFEKSLRRREPLSVILLDVDHFKSYNDTFGHLAGDEVLRQIAQFLTQGARVYDVVARYGGEEFAILLPATTENMAMTVAERIRKSIENHSWVQGEVRASLGVCGWRLGMESGPAIVSGADRALYASKNKGRNRSTRYDHLTPEDRLSA
jgi:diguanylate cyclase (GGDEF)-like protein